jgi:hypothetical protein
VFARVIKLKFFRQLMCRDTILALASRLIPAMDVPPAAKEYPAAATERLSGDFAGEQAGTAAWSSESPGTNSSDSPISPASFVRYAVPCWHKELISGLLNDYERGGLVILIDYKPGTT